MTGDLSNITAPPFVLDTKSVVEIPGYWAENPAMFISPTLYDDPADRALAILKSFLGGMKSQCYMGHTEEEGVKKPLNAFLGEVFLGHWQDEKLGKTCLVSEQVSHHPPITACRVWNAKYGVVAEGYNRQKITFSMGSIRIGSTGFVLKSLEQFNEHYLIPLPDFRVKGILSGAPYPEMSGDWYIPSTSGYMSKISFTGGKGFFGGGKKHEFSASLYKQEEGENHPLYTIRGCWNTEFVIRDERKGEDIETFNVVEQLQNLPELQLPPVEEMDPWESRRAWADTVAAIKRNDFKGTGQAKGFLEQGQRDMRKEEQMNNTQWQQAFFKNKSSHNIAEQLMDQLPGADFKSTLATTNGVWRFDSEAYEEAQRPIHPGIEPDNVRPGRERRYSQFRESSRSSISSQSRASRDFDRESLSGAASPRMSIDSAQFYDSDMDEKVRANGHSRKASVDSVRTDVGEQHKNGHRRFSKDQTDLRTYQWRKREGSIRSSIEGLSLQEKAAVENMLRDQYTSSGR